MKCPNCGKELKKSTKHPGYWRCSDCKKRFKFYEDDSTTSKIQKKNNTAVTLVSIFVIIGVVVLFVYIMAQRQGSINKDEYDAQMQDILFSVNAQGDTIINIIDDMASEDIDLTAAYTQLGSMDTAISVNQDKIDCGEFVLNISKSIIEKDDKSIELTKNELKILHYLVLNKEKIVSRNEIMDYLWESENFIDDNTLTVNIKRLRNKLEELGLNDVIETKRGQGYILK